MPRLTTTPRCISEPLVGVLPIRRKFSVVLLSAREWRLTNTCRNDNHDYCFSHKIGYSPADVMSNIENTSFSEAYRESAKGLTRVMVLHPVACGVSFIAFLLGVGSGFFGSLLAALVSLVALIITLVALVCDFVLFAIIRNHVNSDDNDTSGSHATYSVAIWTILVAAICSLIGAVILFFTCCSARLHKRRNDPVAKNDYGTATTTRRRRWY